MSVEQGKIIDSHSFYGHSKMWGIPERTGAYFAKEKFPDTRFLVIPFQAQSNAATLEKIKRNPQILGMYLMFNPNEQSRLSSPSDAVRKIRKLMGNESVVGLKSHPALFDIKMNDKRYFPYYAAAQRSDLPVLLHAAGSGQDYNSAQMTREVIERFPDLKIILAHFGGLNPKYMGEAVKLAEEFPNIYLNTTGMNQLGRSRRTDNKTFERTINTDIPEEEVKAMKQDALALFFAMCIRRPGQILFGSDLGYNPPEEYSRWPITEVEDHPVANLIYLENPNRLFGKRLKQAP